MYIRVPVTYKVLHPKDSHIVTAMNKSELIQSLSTRLSDIPEKDIDQATRSLLELIASTLEKGGRCEVRGFGSFSMHTRKAGMRRNPKTGEPVRTPEKQVPHFKPGKLLRETVASK